MKTTLSDNPLVFMLPRNTLKGRMDVNYYKPEFRETDKRLRDSPYELTRTKDILRKIQGKEDISGGATPKTTEDFYRDEHEGVPFLRIQNIAESEIIWKGMKYIRHDVHDKMLGRSKLGPGDVLLTITGRVGFSAVVPKDMGDANINQHIVRMHFVDAVNPNYVACFFNTRAGRMQSLRNTTGMTRIALDYEAIKNFIIPLPPRAIQDKVASLMNEALKKKKEKEKGIESLLNSVDDYSLKELGITLPEFEAKSPLVYDLEARFLKNGRWDAEYWKSGYREVENTIKNGKYSALIFGQLISKIINGLDYRNFGEIGAKYLRVGNIKPFEIDTRDIKFVPISLETIDKDISLAENDILLTRKGTFGVALAVGDKDRNYIISSEVFKIVMKKDMGINVHYIVALLNSVIGRNQFSRKSVGAIMGSLSQESVRSILIPVPPRPIQDKIAKEIRSRIDRAKQQGENARKLLRDATEKIERMVLGEMKI